MRQAALEASAAMAIVKELAVATVRAVRADVQALLPSVLQQTGTQVHRAKQNLVGTRQTLFERA